MHVNVGILDIETLYSNFGGYKLPMNLVHKFWWVKSTKKSIHKIWSLRESHNANVSKIFLHSAWQLQITVLLHEITMHTLTIVSTDLTKKHLNRTCLSVLSQAVCPLGCLRGDRRSGRLEVYRTLGSPGRIRPPSGGSLAPP